MADELAVEVREARPEDRDAVFAFCEHTWEDGDYIPRVWDDWLSDDSSVALVGVADGQPVALCHVRLMAPDEAWIEGVRVAPEMRRLGVGRVIISRSLAQARDMGATTVRMFTSAANVASQRLFGRFGFQKVAELSWYTADALPHASDEDAQPQEDDSTPFDPANAGNHPETTVGALPGNAHIRTPGPADFDRIWDWLVQSNLTPFNGGIELHHWAGRAVSEPALRGYLAASEVIELEEWGATQALAIVTEDRAADADLEVRYMDGLSDAIGRLALLLRGEASRRRLSRVWLWLPDLLILRDAMDGAGFARGDADAMWVYARDF